MLLGDLLAAARRSAKFVETLLNAENPELARAVARTAARRGQDPAGFVRMAVADFDRFATQEDWQNLTARLRNHPDPGTVCLLEMVRWRVEAESRAATAAAATAAATQPPPETRPALKTGPEIAP